MDDGIDALIDDGHEAVRRGDAAAARSAFSAALEQRSSGDILKGLADAAYLAHDYGECLELNERAYAAFRFEGDAIGAIRAAREIAFLYGALRGDGAVMGGWIQRAQTLLGSADDTSERGWIALTLGMFEADRTTRDHHFTEALEIGRSKDDADLEFTAMAYLGASLVHSDRAQEGMRMLDEALAAVAGGEVEHFDQLSEIFCQLMSACEHTRDVVRADQWIRVGTQIAERRNLPVLSAFCRTHYGGVLAAAGRWPEADEALSEATRIWGSGFRHMQWTALVRLADLRVRQGRFEEAEQLLAGHEEALDAARPLAVVQLTRDNPTLAADTLLRALNEFGQDGIASAPLLSLLVDVEIARGDTDAAQDAVVRLQALAERAPSPYLVASAALAAGRVCVAAGSGDPGGCFRDALAGFAKAQLPIELAHARLELARALANEEPEVAIAEATAAFESFERLQAARDADAAAAVLRALGGPARTGPKGRDALTKREAEVLELLGLGLSNPEISDRLFISRKTVEHHVGNVLAKLGLRGRAEAAAYAIRENKIVP